jgi:hypothetical protein
MRVLSQAGGGTLIRLSFPAIPETAAASDPGGAP